MVSPTKKKYIRKLLWLPVFAALLGCKIDHDKKADPEKFRFEVTDDADLFFRNVRQIYYDRQSPDGKWQAYRLSDRYIGDDRPMITPVIVIQWLKDEAYLLVEGNSPLDSEDEWVVVIASDTVRLRERGRERMLHFATKIYAGIQQKTEMKLKVSSAFVPFLESEPDRESFRIVMSDFYRLTGVY